MFAILRFVLASLLAVAWSLITFFVLPLIMLRHEGPISAIKESFSLLKRSWGTQVAGGLRIGGIIFLIGILPGILLFIVGVFGWVAVDSAMFGVPFISVGVVLLILASILIGTLRAVFSVALLHYAEDGSAIGPFDAEELRSAVKLKGSRA